MKAMNDAVEESANVISVIAKFAANLIAPAEDEGKFRISLYTTNSVMLLLHQHGYVIKCWYYSAFTHLSPHL